MEQPVGISWWKQVVDREAEISKMERALMEWAAEMSRSLAKLEKSQAEIEKSIEEIRESQAEIRESQAEIRESQAEMGKSLAKLEESQAEMRESQAEQRKSVAHMQWRMNRTPLRALLAAVRRKVNGSHDLTPDEKTGWNQRVANMGACELEALHLTREQLALTEYDGSEWGIQGNAPAVKAHTEEVAYAVMDNGEDYQRLFEFVYGVNPKDCITND